MVFLSTFVLFPLLGVSARLLAPGLLPDAAVGRLDPAHRAALDGAGLDRFYVGGRRQRAGGAVQRFRLEPARRFPDAPDRRFPAHPPRRSTSPRARFLPSSCSCCCPSSPVSCCGRGSALISRAIRSRSRAWITARSCSSSTRLSAMASWTVSGIRSMRASSVQARARRYRAARDRDDHPDLCEQAARLFAGR